MKQYIAPDLRQVKLAPQDVIAASTDLLNYLDNNGYEVRQFDFEEVTE